MFRKILYPTDFSKVADRALVYVKKLKEAGTGRKNGVESEDSDTGRKALLSNRNRRRGGKCIADCDGVP